MNTGQVRSSISEFSQKGEEIYQKKIKKTTDKQKGKIVAIEVESADYFIADTVLQAGMAGKKNILINSFISSE